MKKLNVFAQALMVLVLSSVSLVDVMANGNSGGPPLSLPNALELSRLAPSAVVLTSRYTGGDYLTATYSFRHMNQGDVELTRNNWEILFEGRVDFERDYFRVDMVTDDNSDIAIVDRLSCETGTITVNRGGSAYFRYLRNLRDGFAEIEVGECYLVGNRDSDGSMLTLFRVASHEKSKSVTIDQIRVVEVIYSPQFIQDQQIRRSRRNGRGQ